MKNIKNNKGFTLAELLIVIAIIAALVAIMIPTFSGQVQKARQAADIANLRAAYADATSQYLNGTEKPAIPNVVLTADSLSDDADNLPFTVTGFAKGTKTATFEFPATGKPSCSLS